MVDHISGKIRTVIGLPQGYPRSTILYLFYNADLIEACTNFTTGTIASGFIDDVATLALGELVEKNLETPLEAHGEATKWADTHGSV